MEIGDINVDSIEQPIRSLTPTPTIDSTIMAGHLDYSIEGQEKNMESTLEDTDSDEVI